RGAGSKAAADRIHGRRREIKRAVAPPFIFVHPCRLALVRVGDEQRGTTNLLGGPSAADFSAAGLGDGDDKGVVGVRRKLVGGEIGAQQAQARNALALPIGRAISGISTRHVNLVPPLRSPTAAACLRSALSRESHRSR